VSGAQAAPDLTPVPPAIGGRRGFALALLAIAALSVLLRVVFLTADPPWHAPVGVTWHDEGAWTHNARNRALYGLWRTDEWNPVFIAPVFTLLEYFSFSAFGVGFWQARLVSAVMGVASVVLLGLGVRRLAGAPAGLIAAALLATNYVHVMFSRAALMEATMVGFLVASWYCYVRASTSAVWGVPAGICALLAYFTKAAAVFYVGALGLDAMWAIVLARRTRDPSGASAALFTLAGLGLAGIVSLAMLAGPQWAEYWFYNWQVSVTRKPIYTARALLDRASWFPIIHDFFTRMWLVMLVAFAAALNAVARWRERAPGERLLVLWLVLGAAELVLHDLGNERRLVFLVPALAGLAALLLGRDRRLLDPSIAAIGRRRLVLALPVLLFLLYMSAGSIARLAFIYEVRPGVYLSTAVAVAAGVLIVLTWPRPARWLSRDRWSVGAALALAGLVAAGDLAQFGQWAAVRTYKNYEAARALGEWLPPGTVVHGKLANGLALENRIRPVFVGRGFGNYEDRLARDDIRYLVTYTSPYLGYEGPVIRDVLAAYPNWTIVRGFDVAETATGHDRAALIDKRPAEQDARAHD
jgi:4-amino-4-deoxy-L-arabinose transferase-like glycosyltransferase